MEDDGGWRGDEKSRYLMSIDFVLDTEGYGNAYGESIGRDVTALYVMYGTFVCLP